MPKLQDILTVILQRDGLISKTILSSRRGFLIKFLSSSLSLGMIGCLTVRPEREKLLAHQTRNKLVESVARSTIVISLREQIIILVFVKVDTKFEFS